jgi:hypothetical protein
MGYRQCQELRGMPHPVILLLLQYLDDLRRKQIVLANGTIANINRESALDLFWALRGGGNNFGIVTRFSLITYPQGAAWGGYNFHLMSHTDISSRLTTLNLPPPHSPITFLQSIIASTVSLIWRADCKLGYCISINDLFETFQNASLEIEKDPFAHILMAFVYVTDVNLYMGCSLAHYTKHIGGPEVFKNYNKLPHIYTSLRNATLRDFGLEDMKFNSPGYRYVIVPPSISLKPIL